MRRIINFINLREANMKRRDFIKKSAAATSAIAATQLFGGIPVHAMTHPLQHPQLFATNDNILVVVQLFGGNDGLNSFIPFENPVYYQNRPTLAIPKQQVLRVNNPTMGLHPVLTGFKNLFDKGKLAVVQGVGYENANRSHFRSTDIWLTSSGASSTLFTGWAGRYLDYTFPTFPLQLPDDPFSVQIGGTLSLMLQGAKGGMGISLLDPDEFFRTGKSNGIDEDVAPGTPYGDEYLFVRAIKQQSDKYSTVVKSAFDRGSNKVNYASTNFAQQLRLVARLISGGLKSRIYLVYLGGFDTHVNQAGVHQNLLKTLSDASDAFITDLSIAGISKNVVGMTVSEFGRRTHENGSQGTDHGAASAQFIFGDMVNSGVLGADPDFSKVDSSGDLLYSFDYRQIYSEMLEHWFDVPKDDVTSLLGGRFIPLPLLQQRTGVSEIPAPNEITLHQNYPNPVTHSSVISYQIEKAGHVQMELFNEAGKRVATIVDAVQQAGEHSIPFDARAIDPGVYIYRLNVGSSSMMKKMIVVR